MNFQEKMFETTAELRARAAALANVAVATARAAPRSPPSESTASRARSPPSRSPAAS